MWRLIKEFRFEAAHQLVHHDGKCSRLHGHSWVGRVVVKGNMLHTSGPKKGMVMDYADISAPVKVMVDQFLDHYFLNETLGMDSPTSENIAKWVYNHLRRVLPTIVAVEIDETCTSSCRYEEAS